MYVGSGDGDRLHGGGSIDGWSLPKRNEAMLKGRYSTGVRCCQYLSVYGHHAVPRRKFVARGRQLPTIPVVVGLKPEQAVRVLYQLRHTGSYQGLIVTLDVVWGCSLAEAFELSSPISPTRRRALLALEHVCDSYSHLYLYRWGWRISLLRLRWVIAGVDVVRVWEWTT